MTRQDFLSQQSDSSPSDMGKASKTYFSFIRPEKIYNYDEINSNLF